MTTTADTLEAIASDWRPSRRDTREAIRKAVHMAAYMNDGVVHIADVRAFLPEWVDPPQMGAFIHRLVARGYLVDTGVYRPNGGGSGNANKPAMVRRLARPIPESKV